MQLAAGAPVYGRYEVVLTGSASADGKQFGPKGLRFVEAGEQASALTCGPQGATLIILIFDRDAAESYGGSTEEVLAKMEK
jgi:hypothetical protein